LRRAAKSKKVGPPFVGKSHALGRVSRASPVDTVKRIFTHGFLPAASPRALQRIGREIRTWALHHRNDKSLKELAAMYNPTIRGWIAYYSHFYRTQLRPTLRRINAYVIRWARRKYKRMVHQTRGAREWFDRLRRSIPRLFAHWPLRHGNGRTSGAV
jgi:RNA-directed DNA polymerase